MRQNERRTDSRTDSRDDSRDVNRDVNHDVNHDVNRDDGEPAAQERVGRVVDAGERTLHQAQAQVAREREPRWRVLARGRVVLVVYLIALVMAGLLAFAAHNTSV